MGSWMSAAAPEPVVADESSNNGFNKLISLRAPLQEFIRTGDFGLLDPTQPPSEQNPPLSTLIQCLTESSSFGILIPVFTIYIKYHKLGSDNTFRFDDLMKKLFASQVSPELDLNAVMFADVAKLIALNRASSSAIEYQNTDLYNILRNTRKRYNRVKAQ